MRSVRVHHVARTLLIGGLIGFAVACGPDTIGPAGPDANVGDGGASDTDAGPQSAGLQFRFRSAPKALPTPSSGDFDLVIERAIVTLRDVRAVGDAAPGDSRTTHSRLTLDFEQKSLNLEFPGAPPGVYSFFIGQIADYRMEGTLRIEGGPIREWKIVDAAVAGVSVNVDLESKNLESGLLTVGLKVDLRTVTEAVDWAEVARDEEPDETLDVESDDPQIGELRQRVAAMFTLDD